MIIADKSSGMIIDVWCKVNERIRYQLYQDVHKYPIGFTNNRFLNLNLIGDRDNEWKINHIMTKYNILNYSYDTLVMNERHRYECASICFSQSTGQNFCVNGISSYNKPFGCCRLKNFSLATLFMSYQKAMFEEDNVYVHKLIKIMQTHGLGFFGYSDDDLFNEIVSTRNLFHAYNNL